MQNKLQELTDQLYEQGLAKGRQDGDRYLAQARHTADETVAAARKQAEEILQAAREEADALRAKAESDVRMASQQALQATRSDIENMIVARLTDKPVMSDPDFLKEIIRAVARNFSASETSDMALVLPEALRAQLEPWIKGELSRELAKPVEVSFSKKNSGGFTIGPKDGSYFISMTDKSFAALIAEYMRPTTRKLLFGE